MSKNLVRYAVLTDGLLHTHTIAKSKTQAIKKFGRNRVMWDEEYAMGARAVEVQMFVRRTGDKCHIECIDPDCGWAGLSTDCFIPKNHPERLICPDCGKEAELADTY